MLRLVVLLLALGLPAGLSGCAGPWDPDLGDHAWVYVDAEPWFLKTRGCGFCTGQGPEGSTLVLYRDGSVLWFSHGISKGGLRFEPGLGPWHAEIRAVTDPDANRHVYEVRTQTVAEWPTTSERLEALHPHLEDPGAPDFGGCADCSSTLVQAFDPDVTAHLYGNFEPEGPWGRILQELQQVDRATQAAWN